MSTDPDTVPTEPAPTSDAVRTRQDRAAGLRLAAEVVAGLSVAAAAFVVPLVWTDQTPYALDIKWPVLGACALVAGLSLLVHRAAGGRLFAGQVPVARMLGLYLCVGAASTALSAYPLAGLRQMWWHIAAAVLFLAATVAFRRKAWANAFVTILLASAFLVALTGCLQAMGVDPVSSNWSKGEKSYTLGPGQRVLGTIGLETALGGYMATCAVLALGVALFGRDNIARGAAGLASVPMLICLVFSGTRTAWFAFAVGLVALLVDVDYRRVKRALRSPVAQGVVVLAALAAICLSLGVWPMVKERVKSVGGHVATRGVIWRSAGAMAYARPALGHGPGTFSRQFAQYRPADYWRHRVGAITLHAHNEYLDVLAETGIVGGVAFVLLIGLVVKGSVRVLARFGVSRRPLVAAALAAAAVILVHAAFNVDTRYPTCLMIWWVVMGLAVAQWAGPKRTQPGRPWPMWIGAGAVLLAVVVAGAIWCRQVWRPYLARTHLRKSNEAQKVGNWDQAARHASLAVETDPISVPSRHALGKTLFRAGRMFEAIATFDQLRSHSPGYSNAPLYEAAAHAVIGDMQSARIALRRARRHAVAYGRFAEPLTDAEFRELARRFQQTGATR
jgi:O-antigen ligase